MLKIRNARIEDLSQLVAIEQLCFTKEEAATREASEKRIRDISGGEWRRIALSRSLFKNSNIIVLDEPTASLDPESELYIFKKFLELVKNKTAIYISHRMASARMANRIIVLKNGEIVEDGTHEDLMKKRRFIIKCMNLKRQVSVI